MRKIKVLVVSLLIAVLITETPLYVYAARYGDDTGYLTFTDAYSGEKKDVFVKVTDGVIYASPEDIADICDVQVNNEAEKGLIRFERNGYFVDINLNTGYTYLSNERGYISRQVFNVEGDLAQDEKTYIPLEKVMYLLNVGWQIIDGEVLIEKPVDTLWNVLNEYEELAANRPTLYDLTGDNVYGKSVKYILLSLADEIDYKIFVPVINEWAIETEKITDAFYSLGTEDSEMFGAEENIGEYLDDFIGSSQECVGVLSQYYGMEKDISDLQAFLAKRKGIPFNRWEEIQDPKVVKTLAASKELTDLSNKLKIVDMVWNISYAYNRVAQWGDSYLGQLKALNEADITRFTQGKDRAILFTELAGILYDDKKDLPELITASVILDRLFTEIFNLSSVGRVIGIYNTAVDVAKTVSPEIKGKLEMGDHAYEANLMTDIGTIALYNFCDVMTDLTYQKDISPDNLKEARDSYMLMIRSYLHTWDGISEVKAEEGDTAAKQKYDELKEKAYALSIRLNETARYDNTLILEEDFGNLYNDDMDAGGIREQIPVSAIKSLEEIEKGKVKTGIYNDSEYEPAGAYCIIVTDYSEEEIVFSVDKMEPDGNYEYVTNLIHGSIVDGTVNFSWTDSWFNEGTGVLRLGENELYLQMEETVRSDYNYSTLATDRERTFIYSRAFSEDERTHYYEKLDKSEEELSDDKQERNESLSEEELQQRVVDHYTAELPEGDGGNYVIFDSETRQEGDVYYFVLRYQMSDKEAEEAIQNGKTPSANRLAGQVKVDTDTGEVSMDGEIWYLW